ncbi:MAG: class I SAM-dependent methyltransferase [Oscillospiraceae bacterium]|nr:class I SAM-dependent methyltransferase [Oscillospiraceae bacterium]
MNDDIKAVQEHYDANVLKEWNRIAGRPEFLLTCRMLDRYIKPGDKVLDIGGGPGRYTFYLAKKGCEVTLFDLSPENIKFAGEKSVELNLPVKTVCGEARTVDKLVSGQFDRVLFMGPIFHLLEETDRKTALNAALNLLKSNGVIFISFITLFAVMIYYMKQAPDAVALDIEKIYIDHVLAQKTFAGDAFTKAVFMEQSEILPFMSQFPLEKLHLFGQESITSPCENNIMSQPEEIINLWLDLCEKLWEREDLLSWSEHLMYVGRKT